MTSIEDYMLPCLNKKLFGIECMGCGLQRSISLILHGEFKEAFFMYPAVYTLIALFSVIAFSLFKSFRYSNRIITILAITNGIIIIVNFIFKTFIN
ncbi:DUF2752 domain-containing protein [Flavobacteriaceae bacterium XHP0103]|uniref:DUF2752 domain-containing protein n=1 Tax=Marixanthotalea marina TaxID=2844359 RepID=UPI002989AD9C|nr:DUF2752 domain-containing protein [Marixanthotalea marina]MBU3822363.1 DUF2752 domain-containing protein [Marixanthotalea marina]